MTCIFTEVKHVPLVEYCFKINPFCTLHSGEICVINRWWGWLWRKFGSHYQDKLSIHLVRESVHLTINLGISKTMALSTMSEQAYMHVENNWETDYLQYDLYVDISYKFNLAWVFVSRAYTQITMNTCINDLVLFTVKARIFNNHKSWYFRNSHELHP